MIVKVITREDKNDYRQALEIEVDGKCVCSFIDGEPEDANLNRDFNDCYSIASLMEKAWKAGHRGDDFEIIDVEEEW